MGKQGKSGGTQCLSLPSTQRPGARSLALRLSMVLAYQIAPHLDGVSIVNKPVQDSVGQRRIADLSGGVSHTPAFHRWRSETR